MVNLIQMTIISTTVGKNHLEEWSNHYNQQKSPKNSTWVQSEKQQKDLCSFPRQTIQSHSIQVYAQPAMLQKLKLSGSMKTYKAF